MVTPSQVLKKLKSLEYRLKLSKALPDLEKDIMDLCDEYNTNVLCGYKINVEDGHISLEKLPENYKQLKLSFNNNRKTERLEERIESFRIGRLKSYFDGQYHGCSIKLKVVRNQYSNFHPRYLNSPEDVYDFLKDLGNEDRERFISIFLDVRNAITGLDEVSVGSISSSIIHPREVFKAAILTNSKSIIFAHNHPSGDPSPSEDDIGMTRRLIKASEIVDIKILDHIIIGYETYRSFKQEGLLGCSK